LQEYAGPMPFFVVPILPAHMHTLTGLVHTVQSNRFPDTMVSKLNVTEADHRGPATGAGHHGVNTKSS